MKNIKIFIILIIKKLEKFSSIFFEKATFLDKFFKYFFVTFILIFYLIFKQYFDIGMGGDDGRFYMFYPTKYNQGKNINNKLYPLGEKFSTEYLSNTLYILSNLEKIGFGYKDFYFLIFFLGFYFFYLSLKEIKKYYNFEGPLSNYFIFFLSLLYPANPLVVDQVWNNHWASIFTIVGTPLVFLVFLKLIFKNLKFIEIIIYNLIFTALSIYFANLVQLQVTVILFIILSTIYILFNSKEIKYFFLRLLILIFLFLTSNLNWLNGIIFNRTSSPYEAINTTSADAAWINMKASLEYYQTFNNFNFIFLNGVNPNSSFDIIYYFSLLIFSLVVIFSIFYLVYFTLNTIIKKQKFDYFAFGIFLSLIAIGYLQSIALSKLGIDVFLFLSKHIFVLNGLRNYINKVPITYSLVLLIAIFLVFRNMIKKNKSIAVVFLVVSVVFSMISLRNLAKLEDYKFNLNEGYTRTASFDSETLELINYLKKDKRTQRTAYFPLSIGPWSIIKNEQTKELYIGHSPILGIGGVDDLNGMFNIEGLGFLNTKFVNEDFLGMEPEKIIFRLKFLGVDKLVVNNTIDLEIQNYMGYPKTSNYSEILRFVKNNLKLDFETKNKNYSVYGIDNNQIQFKKYLYKPDNAKMLNFYSVNFDEASFTFSSISDNYFNFIPSSTTLSNSNLDEFLDNFGNITKMKEFKPEKSEILFSDREVFYSLKVEGNNVLRIKVEYPKDIFNVSIAVDEKNVPCSNRVFDKNSTCSVYKNIKPQLIDNYLIYSLESGPNNPKYMYVLIENKKPKELNIKDLKTNFLIADTNQVKYDPFSVKERQRYLDKYFIANPKAPQYQVPEKIELERKDKDTYSINLKLKDKKLPFIIILKNAYNSKWVLEGENIEKQTNFNSDTVFNGWIVEPSGFSESLNLTIKYKETSTYSYLNTLSYFSIALSLLFVIIYLIYGTYKILIRKFWR